MIRRPPRSTQSRSSAASDVYKRERVAGEKLLRQPQLRPERADFVLEELAHRLENLQAQFLRKTSDVVVRLDDGRWPLDRDRFDDVGIESPLRQIPRVGELLRLSLEDLDERR